MFINLYQINSELDNGRLMFRNLKTILTANGNQIPAHLYECVFSGELDVQDAEDVFRIFNLEHPKGYRGRSMSVSDVVEFVHTPNKSNFYFCDSIGFAQVEFDKQSAKRLIVNRDYEMDC